MTGSTKFCSQNHFVKICHSWKFWWQNLSSWNSWVEQLEHFTFIDAKQNAACYAEHESWRSENSPLWICCWFLTEFWWVLTLWFHFWHHGFIFDMCKSLWCLLCLLWNIYDNTKLDNTKLDSTNDKIYVFIGLRSGPVFSGKCRRYCRKCRSAVLVEMCLFGQCLLCAPTITL